MKKSIEDSSESTSAPSGVTAHPTVGFQPDEGRIAEFNEYKKTLFAAKISNYEKADAAILTLSTAVLGVSMSFIKDLQGIESATWVKLIPSSWVCLCLSIMCVVCSFFTGQSSLNAAEDLAVDYYLRGDEDAFADWKKKVPMVRITELLNLAGGVLFLIAILATVIFFIVNFGAYTISGK